MKLIKASLILTTVFYALHHYNIVKGVPSIVIPEDFPSVISEKIQKVSSSNELRQLSTADLVEKIQKNKIQDIHAIWKQFGIKAELFKKGTPFLAESFTISLPPNETLLYVFQLTNNETNDWQYLCFNIKNRAWNFYGHIDLPNQDLAEPISRPVSIEDRTWLVITSQADSSDLPGMYQEHWYDLSGSKLKEALQYYVYQDQTVAGFTKRYSATILETGISGGTYFIDLNTELAYLNDQTAQPGLESVFSLSRKVRYLWDRASQTFKNHQTQSDKLYTYQADQILSQNYLQLEDLATRKGLSQQKLIRRFLNLCSDSIEKRRVLKVLR